MKDHSERYVLIVMFWTAVLLAWVLLCVIGCAHTMKYDIPEGKTQSDYEKARVECGGNSLISNNSMGKAAFNFYPAMPFKAAEQSRREKNFQKCMEGYGYRCVEDCAIGKE